MPLSTNLDSQLFKTPGVKLLKFHNQSYYITQYHFHFLFFCFLNQDLYSSPQKVTITRDVFNCVFHIFLSTEKLYNAEMVQLLFKSESGLVSLIMILIWSKSCCTKQNMNKQNIRPCSLLGPLCMKIKPRRCYASSESYSINNFHISLSWKNNPLWFLFFLQVSSMPIIFCLLSKAWFPWDPPSSVHTWW